MGTETSELTQALLAKINECQKNAGEGRLVEVTTWIPDKDLTTEQLVERIKAIYKGDAQCLYGMFVKHRSLNPEISMSQFAPLFAHVWGNPHTKTEKVKFSPTHLNTTTGEPLMVTFDDGKVVRWISASGGTGSDPKQFFKHTPIQ